MTQKTLVERLRELHEAATAGPWEIGQERHPGVVTIYDPQEGWHYTIADCSERNLEGDEHDAALIVALRNNVDHFLNLEAENERLRTAITKIKTGYESQMKFCDIEPLPYFRRFVDQLRTALGDK